MKKRRNILERIGTVDYVILIVLGLFALVCIYPFYQTLLLAFSSEEAYAAHPLYMLPYSMDFSAFKIVFADSKFWTAMLVTIGTTVIDVVACMVVTVSGAYVLAKKDLVGGKFFSFLVVFTMMIQAPLIPVYLNIRNLGLYDNLLVYVLPVLVNFYYMLLMRNYFNEIPPDLTEAAEIDGANPITILTKILVPISKPFIATFCLFFAVERWNEWYIPNIYIMDPEKFTLQYYLRTTLADMNQTLGEIAEQMIAQGVDIQVSHDGALRSASILLAALPIVCVYPFVQKYLIKGMTAGAVKG